MYAIIVTGGKQYKVQQGEAIYVEKLNVEAGEKVIFEQVVFLSKDGTNIGTPFISNATVTGIVEKQGHEKKVVSFKYKPKKGQHTKIGHRQPYTKVVIDAINY